MSYGALQEQLKQLERSLELRDRAVAAREAAVERKAAEAVEAAAEAQIAARQDVEREYLDLKSGLAQQRMQLEVGGGCVRDERCVFRPLAFNYSFWLLEAYAAINE